LCLRRFEIGALDGIVELQQDRAILNLLIGEKADLLDDAGGFNGQVDARTALPCRSPRCPASIDRFDDGRRHGRRRRLHRGEILLDRVVAEQVEADDAAAHQHKQNKGDDKALDHEQSLGRRNGRTSGDISIANPDFK
jgi:hypothetical protein